MNRPDAFPSSEPPARRFSREIDGAVASGLDLETLVLRLTLMDASKIKRDPDIPVESVSFTPEGMRFLGVRVTQGGVRTSTLSAADSSPPEEPAADPAPAPARKTRAKKTVAKAR